MRGARLVTLLLLLRTRGRLTARELARELEVSVRTVHRDIEALSGGGVPIYAERGPAGGFRLMDGHRLDLSGLTGEELEALALLGRADLARDLGWHRARASAELKVRDALSDEQRARIDSASQYAYVESTAVVESREAPHVRALLSAAREQRVVLVRWRDGGKAREEEWAALGVVHSGRSWFVVALLPEGVRVHAVARVTQIEATPRFFARPSASVLEQYWHRYGREHVAEESGVQP